MRLNNFGTGGNIFTKLLQTTCREAGVMTCVQFLLGMPPKIWEGQKTSKFRRDFRQLSTLTLNISGKDLHCVSKNWGRHIMPRNSRKCAPISIILSLSHSQMNCRKRLNKTYHLTSNLLPHYRVKFECSTLLLYSTLFNANVT